MNKQQLRTFFLSGSFLLASTVSAQSGFFVGGGLSGLLSSVDMNAKVDYFDPNNPDLADSTRDRDDPEFGAGFRVHAGYRLQLNQKFSLSTSVFATANSGPESEIKSYSFNTTPGNPVPNIHHSASVTSKLKPLVYGVMLTPAYALNAHNEFFLNIGMEAIKLDNTIGQTYLATQDGEISDVLPEQQFTKTENGVLFGVGYRHLIMQNLSLFASMNYASFKSYSVSRQIIDSTLKSMYRTETYKFSDIGLTSFNVGVDLLI